MNSRPISIRNIDVNRVAFVPGLAKAGRNPGINFKYDGQNLQIMAPRLSFPGGVLIRDSEAGTTTYTLIASLRGCDPFGKERATAAQGDIGILYNFALDLNERIIQEAVTNSVKWFGKKRSEEAIRDSFKPVLSISVDKVNGEYVPNGKYPPSIRLKIPVYDNKVSTEVVDTSRNPVYTTPESLPSVFPKMVDASTVFSGSIYVISGNSFGVTFRTNMAQVFPQAKVTARDIDWEDGGDASEKEESSPEVDALAEQLDTALNVEIPDNLDAAESAAPQPPAPARKRRAAGAL